MPQQGFAATIGGWCQGVKDLELAVFRESTQRLFELAQLPVAEGGHMRVDTGFLRASFTATLGQPGFSVTYNPNGPAKVSYNDTAVALVIATAQITDTISAVYTANYAVYREYGTNGQPPDGFVRAAAQMWPVIVDQVVRDAKARTG